MIIDKILFVAYLYSLIMGIVALVIKNYIYFAMHISAGFIMMFLTAIIYAEYIKEQLMNQDIALTEDEK